MKLHTKVGVIIILAATIITVAVFSASGLSEGSLYKLTKLTPLPKKTLQTEVNKKMCDAYINKINAYQLPNIILTNVEKKRLQELIIQAIREGCTPPAPKAPIGINKGRRFIDRRPVNPPASPAAGLCERREFQIQPGHNEFTVTVCDYLINSQGLKYFISSSNGVMTLYWSRQFQGRNLLLGYEVLDAGNRTPDPLAANNGGAAVAPPVAISYTIAPLTIYAKERLIIILPNSPEDNFSIRVDDACPVDNPYCNFVESIAHMIFQQNGIIHLFIDGGVFSTLEAQDEYLRRTPLNEVIAYDFLSDILGFVPPIDKIVEFIQFTPNDRRGSSSTGFAIWARNTQILDMAAVNNIIHGNLHEFTHVFMHGTPVHRSWFEEGLADYTYGRFVYGERVGDSLRCSPTGWREGQAELEVPYSDFNVAPNPNAAFYTPLNRSSYYRSAECFWHTIVEQHGIASLQNIGRAWNATRSVMPPVERMLIRDIINPTLGVDISQMALDRYNYSEN